MIIIATKDSPKMLRSSYVLCYLLIYYLPKILSVT